MFVTSSGAGEVPFYYPIYCSTKHALNGFFYSLQQELLARQSPVSLTVGTFSHIATKDLSKVLKEQTEHIPAFAVGDVKHCARAMMEAYITRPQSISYPKVVMLILRSLWYFMPHYHQITIESLKPPGSQGNGYWENVQYAIDKRELKKELRFQQGYDGN